VQSENGVTIRSLSEPRQPSWPALLKAGAATAFLLVLVAASRRVPLPGVSLVSARTSLASLGIGPLVTGFFVIELFSFTPWGRSLRRAGFAGRARLDRAALEASLVVAAIQAIGIGLFLQRLVGPTGNVVARPGVAFGVLLVVTLTAATAAFFVLAMAIGRVGVGNGFCWLLAWPIVESVTSEWRRQAGQARAEPTEILFGLLWLAPLVALAIWLQRHRYPIAAPAPDSALLRMQLPPLPQSDLPVRAAAALIVGLALLRGASRLSPPSLAAVIVGFLLLIPLLSSLGFFLCGSSRRVATNLGSRSPAERDLGDALRRIFILATVILTVGAIANALLAHFVSMFPAIQFEGVLFLVAFGLDLKNEIAFRRLHGASARLLRLDNVHLATYLDALLRHEGIAVLIRGYHCRSLYFFFNPLIKMDLFVPAEHFEVARALIPADGIKIV
jgi:hypothetical protein